MDDETGAVDFNVILIYVVSGWAGSRTPKNALTPNIPCFMLEPAESFNFERIRGERVHGAGKKPDMPGYDKRETRPGKSTFW